jgi:uncharacterized protein
MDLLKRAATFLERVPQVQLAFAFGSIPEGRAHAESDVDLAVLLDWEAAPDRAVRGRVQIDLLGQLFAALGSNRVDLVILNDASPLFARRILREGVLLFSRDPETLHAFHRDTQLRAADLEPFILKGRARLLKGLGA